MDKTLLVIILSTFYQIWYCCDACDISVKDGWTIVREFKKYTSTGVNFVRFNIHLNNKSTTAPRMLSDTFDPALWVWSKGSGDYLLRLPIDHTILSLGLLSLNTRYMDLVLFEEPRNCLSELNYTDYINTIVGELHREILKPSNASLFDTNLCRSAFTFTHYLYKHNNGVGYKCCHARTIEGNTTYTCNTSKSDGWLLTWFGPLITLLIIYLILILKILQIVLRKPEEQTQGVMKLRLVVTQVKTEVVSVLRKSRNMLDFIKEPSDLISFHENIVIADVFSINNKRHLCLRQFLIVTACVIFFIAYYLYVCLCVYVYSGFSSIPLLNENEAYVNVFGHLGWLFLKAKLMLSHYAIFEATITFLFPFLLWFTGSLLAAASRNSQREVVNKLRTVEGVVSALHRMTSSECQTTSSETQTSTTKTQTSSAETQTSANEPKASANGVKITFGETQTNFGKSQTNCGETQTNFGETQTSAFKTQASVTKTQTSATATENENMPSGDGNFVAVFTAKWQRGFDRFASSVFGRILRAVLFVIVVMYAVCVVSVHVVYSVYFILLGLIISIDLLSAWVIPAILFGYYIYIAFDPLFKYYKTVKERLFYICSETKSDLIVIHDYDLLLPRALLVDFYQPRCREKVFYIFLNILTALALLILVFLVLFSIQYPSYNIVNSLGTNIMGINVVIILPFLFSSINANKLNAHDLAVIELDLRSFIKSWTDNRKELSRAKLKRNGKVFQIATSQETQTTSSTQTNRYELIDSILATSNRMSSTKGTNKRTVALYSKDDMFF